MMPHRRQNERDASNYEILVDSLKHALYKSDYAHNTYESVGVAKLVSLHRPCCTVRVVPSVLYRPRRTVRVVPSALYRPRCPV